MAKPFDHPLLQRPMRRSSLTVAHVAVVTVERLEVRKLFTLPCPAGSYSADGFDDDPETLASPGYYVPLSGATAQTPAQPGYYVPTSGATEQIPADLGYYVPTPAASMETKATAGYFVPVTGATAETPSPAGSYISVSGATSAGQAVLAPAGSYAPAGSSAAISVDAGTYYPDAGAFSSSQALEANPGYYVPSSGSSYETPASPGHYVATAGATRENLAELGYYVPTTAATAATAASPGYYVGTIGATAQTPSPVGSYIAASGATAATPASPGYYVPTIGATTEYAAAPGTYVNTVGASVSTAASPGYYVATSGATVQIPAPLGSYIPSAGAIAAMLASPGYYVPTISATTQLPAPAGSFVAGAGATAATPASPGYYVPTMGASAAIEASPGCYVPTLGASAETLASPGYYVSGTRASAETSAPPGYYAPASGMTAPILSPSGYYVPAPAAITTTPDPAGTFSLSGATAPTPLILSSIDLTYGQQLEASQLSGNIPVAGSYTFASTSSSIITAGIGQQFAVQFTPSDSSMLAPVTGTVTVDVSQAVPAVTISDSGGTYDGGAFPATAVVSGINGNASASLEGVSPVVTYYAGTAATGTPLAAAPTAIGTYTASASFPGSTDYSAASSTDVFSILSNANKLVFVGLPTTATAGHRMAVFKVDLENALGQLVSSGVDSSASVTIKGFSGKVFSARAVHGVATFKNVQTRVAGTDALTASVADQAVTTATASEIIKPAAPAKLVLFSSRTIRGNAGSPLATPLSYRLEDRFGNLEVGISGLAVTLFSKSRIAPTGWSGNTAVLQDGIATFDDLLIDQAGVYVLFARARSEGIGSPSPTTIDLSVASVN